MKKTPKTSIRILKGNWVAGKHDGYEFQAAIFAERSDYGINNGMVSKLWIKGILNYDRGWDEGSELTNIWKPLVAELEKFAQSETFHNAIGYESYEKDKIGNILSGVRS